MSEVEPTDPVVSDPVDPVADPAPAEPAKAEPAAADPAADPAKREATTTGVPDSYTLSLDDDSPLADEHMDEIAAYARKQGLSNEQAQELLDRDSRLVENFSGIQQQAWEKTQDDWYEAAKSDKEIGGDQFAESAELAKRVLQRYGSDSLIDTMKTGYGNNPEIIRMFSRIGKELVEAKLITGDGPVGRSNGKSMADTLYDSK